jgi:hypothetical protein
MPMRGLMRSTMRTESRDQSPKLAAGRIIWSTFLCGVAVY